MSFLLFHYILCLTYIIWDLEKILAILFCFLCIYLYYCITHYLNLHIILNNNGVIINALLHYAVIARDFLFFVFNYLNNIRVLLYSLMQNLFVLGLKKVNLFKFLLAWRGQNFLELIIFFALNYSLRSLITTTFGGRTNFILFNFCLTTKI
jgi:hypothetical protein